MQTMLVPLDGSTLAEQVLPWAQLLAPLLRARVVLLQVFPDPEHEYTITSAPADTRPAGPRGARWAAEQHQRWLRQRRAIETYLEAQAAPLRAAGVEVLLEIEVGLPVACIEQVAERRQASLIALASHGYGRLRRWVAGSIAQQLVQSTTRPILILRPGIRVPDGIARILAPLDGSVYSRHVLAYALALAHSASAELVVLQTIAASIEELISGGSTAAQREALRAHVLQSYAVHFGPESAARARISAVSGLGNPTDAIVEEAERRKVSLVVLANRRSDGARHRAAEHNLDTIFRSVDAPLLLVPARR